MTNIIEVDNKQYPFIDEFIVSVHEIMHTMGYLESHYIKSYQYNETILSGTSGAFMKLDNGYIAILMPSQLSSLIIGSFMGIAQDTLSNSDIDGGVCEILNMVAGSGKTRLAESDYTYTLSMPKPCDHEKLLKLASPDSIIIEFELEESKLLLNINLPSK